MQDAQAFDALVAPLASDPSWRRCMWRIKAGAVVRKCLWAAVLGVCDLGALSGHATIRTCATPAKTH